MRWTFSPSLCCLSFAYTHIHGNVCDSCGITRYFVHIARTNDTNTWFWARSLCVCALRSRMERMTDRKREREQIPHFVLFSMYIGRRMTKRGVDQKSVRERIKKKWRRISYKWCKVTFKPWNTGYAYYTVNYLSGLSFIRVSTSVERRRQSHISVRLNASSVNFLLKVIISWIGKIQLP